jgi:lysozyme family protein
MARSDFDKRQFLQGAGASAIALMLGSRAFAQDDEVLGLKLPKEIVDILPRKPMNYVRVADAVLRMEREADRKNIPDSILSRNKGVPIKSLDDALYQLALPRLVALIDRTETIDVGLADKAGELLAEIHQLQHEVPEALRLAPVGFDMLTPSDTGAGPSFILPEVADAQSVGVLPDPQTVPMPSVEAPVEDIPTPETPPQPSEPEPPAAEPTPPPKPAEPEADKPLSKAKDYASLKEEYGRLYRKLTTRPERQDMVDWHLALIRKSKARYQRVGEQTGVPWYFIAVTHGLESSFNFRAHLHNGDFPLTARTRQVPAGRPSQWLPPSDWESSARDALRLLGYIGQKDWSLERTLYRLEAYNGFGYRALGVPTPYLWSFSNNYDRGKYVADGKFSYTAKSQQCGAAVMLKLLAEAGDFSWPSAA